jgi:hypothetical protein
MLFPFRVATPEPSPIINLLTEVNPEINVAAESGMVPTRLLFVRIIEVSALAALNVNPKKVE